jgi:NAD(P)-dependent dehydrogenase (short-subunit alcohol dehydrogenase family)
MTVDLRITEGDWEKLRQQFAPSFRGRGAAETGALAILGECKTAVKHEFIVVKVLLPGPGDLKISSSGEVVFAASYIRRAHLEMRREKLSGIAAFHTHPFADTSVSFSTYDNQQEPVLAENLIELEPSTRLISVVAGKQSQCGRFYPSPPASSPLRELILVGDHLSYLGLDGRPPAPPPKTSAIFDRGQALTGAGALSRLSRMTVVVVGASGTGSLFCELLARAGCKRIIVIDHDVVKDINLNRILYATAEDVRRGTPKVEVLRRGIEGLGLGCKVEPMQGSIVDRDVLRRVLDGDLVIGCIDRDLPRQLLCEVAFRYLLPYIDIGSEIGGDDDGIVSVDSRVSYVAPGRHCLMCAGVVTPRRLSFESLTESERGRKIALGYSDDLLMTQPAVMDLNMRASASGMLLLRHLLQPFLKDPYPVKLCENAVIYKSRAVESAAKADPKCPTCQMNRRFGYGDCGPAIGFDAKTVGRILGSEAIALASPPEPQSDGQALRAPYYLRRMIRRLFGNS